MKPAPSSSRINWIDEYKGFVLLLVCLFHVEQSFKHVNMNMEWLSACRMTAFFFISGALFSMRRFPHFKDYFIHKTKVLLLPYITLSILFLLIDPTLWDFSYYPQSPKMTIMNTHPVITNRIDYIYWNIVKIFVAGKSSIGSGPLWFVFTLYSISLLFFLSQKLCRKISRAYFSGRRTSRNILTAVIIAISLASGWILYKNHTRLPLGFERDLTTLSFFALGSLAKPLIRKIQKFPAWALVLITIASIWLYSLCNHVGPYFSIMNNDLGKSFWAFFSSSILGITSIVTLMILISRTPFNSVKGLLRYIARNALVILAVHWWALLCLRLMFKKELDHPGIAYQVIPLVIIAILMAIPLFRCKLHWLIGKERISFRESLSLN